MQYCLTGERSLDRSSKTCLCPLVAWVVQPVSKRVNDLFLTPIVRKSGAVLLVGSPVFGSWFLRAAYLIAYWFTFLIFILTAWWHHVNPKSTPISYHVSNVTPLRGSLQTGRISSGTIVWSCHFDAVPASSRLLRAYLGGVLQKKFFYMPCRGT